MLIRILVLVFIININLLYNILIPFLTLILATSIFSLYLWRKAKNIKAKINLASPFTLSPALKFGLLFAVVLALAKVAQMYFSTQGIYLLSIFSGIADVDAIILSLSQLSNSSLVLETARNGIILAALTNICVKGGIAYWWGGKEFARIVNLFFGVLIILGGLLLFLL